MMLNYDDSVVIKIIKVRDELGNFTHWESETQFSENWYGSFATGPTYFGVIDEAFDYIKEVAQFWMSSNANDNKK